MNATLQERIAQIGHFGDGSPIREDRAALRAAAVMAEGGDYQRDEIAPGGVSQRDAMTFAMIVLDALELSWQREASLRRRYEEMQADLAASENARDASRQGMSRVRRAASSVRDAYGGRPLPKTVAALLDEIGITR